VCNSVVEALELILDSDGGSGPGQRCSHTTPISLGSRVRELLDCTAQCAFLGAEAVIDGLHHVVLVRRSRTTGAEFVP
jgi:hypothetical protein